MNLCVKIFSIAILPFFVITSGIVFAGENSLSYPARLLDTLGINSEDISRNIGKFKNDRIHREWMDHFSAVCHHVGPERKNTISRIHCTLLYLKKRLDHLFLAGRIDRREFNEQGALLINWFQKANRSVLGQKDYERLFGLSAGDELESTENPPGDSLGFPIENPETTVKEVKETIDPKKIADIMRFYREKSVELRDFRRFAASKRARDIDPVQISRDMKRIEGELETAYRRYCKKVLSDKEFKMIFGKAADSTPAFPAHQTNHHKRQ